MWYIIIICLITTNETSFIQVYQIIPALLHKLCTVTSIVELKKGSPTSRFFSTKGNRSSGLMKSKVAVMWWWCHLDFFTSWTSSSSELIPFFNIMGWQPGYSIILLRSAARKGSMAEISTHPMWPFLLSWLIPSLSHGAYRDCDHCPAWGDAEEVVLPAQSTIRIEVMMIEVL